jgi:hypothetical protein
MISSGEILNMRLNVDPRRVGLLPVHRGAGECIAEILDIFRKDKL